MRPQVAIVGYSIIYIIYDIYYLQYIVWVMDTSVGRLNGVGFGIREVKNICT